MYTLYSPSLAVGVVCVLCARGVGGHITPMVLSPDI